MPTTDFPAARPGPSSLRNHLKSPVLWGLLLWFYLGNAYLLWASSAWIPAPGHAPRPYLISAEMDPIVGSRLIIGPLMAICGFPVMAIALLFMLITAPIVNLWPDAEFLRRGIPYLCPLITALIFYRIYLYIRSRRNDSAKTAS
jgi:hypothetical protein